MNAGIPSYHDYVRQGQGGPEGACKVCGQQGPMDHGLTGYECSKCRSMNVELKLKNGGVYDQQRKLVAKR